MKILIAEDEKGIAGFLKQGLEEEGYDVLIADNGKIACEIALKQKPDLILLDWTMPQMTGLEACRTIRKKDTTTPILFVTAKDTVQETIEGLKAGANDYIKKPFSFEELLQRIKIHFRYKSESEELVIDKTVIVLPRHEVYQDGMEVALTQKEYDLLVYLVKNKGKVCSRQQIIEDVWNIHFDYDTGVIDVFINALRKKLQLTKEDDFIKAVRGVGYIANDT
ncbi:DNA-binding response regulator [Flavobacterium arcticum]|uniref:DNA-binding response regulator n=1 Tax=Flavobacterium arcticum TaxID=1784713 RepID=A0A345HD14_9FLAO|nr:response regulator transcription factor [Flavobacterium arcticum]AXG74474.1 DNA-binding response regulator [Flavobacterium arcticum]KAF2512405.1 response regulator transcription factor [Flavobacterium arcticum]